MVSRGTVLPWIEHYFRTVTKSRLISKRDELFEGFDRLRDSRINKRALIAYVPSALREAMNAEKITRFNQTGMALEMASAVNELGYIVDMVDFSAINYVPIRDYDLFIGHSNYNFRSIVDNLKENTVIVDYSTGSYAEQYNRQAQERYDSFCDRRGIAHGSSFVRELETDETYPPSRADAVIALGQNTANSFLGVAKDVFAINNAAYPFEGITSSKRDFDKGRNKFICVSGTGGNILKGLDRLIEAFAQTPSCHLYIYSQMEPEILKNYSAELSLENIHYVYHYRLLSRRVLQLFSECVFSICLGINTGQSTAFIGAMGTGLIPVVNSESDILLNDNGSLIPSNSIADIIATIRETASMPVTWCREASIKTIADFESNYTTENFRKMFRQAVKDVIDSKVGIETPREYVQKT